MMARMEEMFLCVKKQIEKTSILEGNEDMNI